MGGQQCVDNARIKAGSSQPDDSTSTRATEPRQTVPSAWKRAKQTALSNMRTFAAVFLVAALSMAEAAPSGLLAPGAALAGPILGPAALSGPVAGPAALAGPAVGPARLSGAVDGGAVVTGAVAGPSLVSGSVAGHAAPWPAAHWPAAPALPWGE